MELTREIAKEVCSISQNIPAHRNIIVREVLEHLAGKWSLWILYVLAVSGDPVRYKDVFEKVQGISHKMLTDTLKALERDGLIVKNAFKNQKPPRTEYQLSPLGRGLLQASTPLWKWIVSSVEHFEQSRLEFHSPQIAEIK
jgi:DNA-binding HxlR family transcriptional regulator